MGDVIGWCCLPLSIGLAAGVAAAATRLGPRTLAAARAASVALLLPGLCLALWPTLPAPWLLPWFPPGSSLFPGFGPGHGRLLLCCRTLGTLPLLLLPVLAVLGSMPSGQARTAAGLGAGASARLRLLWLPQLGPACVAGLALACMVDAASLSRTVRANGTAVLSPSGPPP